MGLWSSLGKIAGVAAAPFTGGASLTALLPDILSGVGSVATGMSKGQSDQRTQGANYGIQRDQLGLQGSRADEVAAEERARILLDQQKQAKDFNRNAFRDALRASLAGNFASPTRPAGVPTIRFTGGKNFGEQGKAASDEMYRQAMIEMLNGEQVDKMPDYKSYQLTSPTEMPKASTLENVLGILGLAGTAAGRITDKDKKKPTGTGLMN